MSTDETSSVSAGGSYGPGAASRKQTGPGPANESIRPEAQQSLTGCIDEQNGQYVLLDDQMLKIANLKSAVADTEVFAKYVGRWVQVSGAGSSERKSVFKVTSIKEVSNSCRQAK